MSFIKECEDYGWWFRSKPSGSTITHTLMNGSGVLIVPMTLRMKFYELCIKHLRMEEKLYLVEQTKSSPSFRMFLDVDYVTDEPVSDETIKQWGIHLNRSFPSMRDIHVSTCTREHEGRYKNGVHMSWPWVSVTSSSANNLIERIRMALTSYDVEVPWDKILDKSVFKTGLRTIWSYKMKRDTREEVVPYMPRFIISSEGVRDISHDKPTAEVMEQFSIFVNGKETEKFGNNETIISGLNAGDELIEWMRELYPLHRIDNIDKVIPKKSHWVISCKSKYCPFIGKDHQHNHGWFLIDRVAKVVVAKCHDEDHKNLSGHKLMVHPKIIKYLQKLENHI